MSKKVQSCFASTMLLTALMIILFAIMVLANPVTFPPYPSEPNKDPPTLTIHSPTNATYHENNIPLNFTIALPDSWTGQNHVTDVSYQVDGQDFVLWSSSTTRDPEVLSKAHQFSTVLMTAADGQHSLKVKIDAVSYYGSSPPSSYDITVSEIVFFSLVTEPSSPSPTLSPSPSVITDMSPSPTVPEFTPAAVLILATVTCLFGVAFRKRR